MLVTICYAIAVLCYSSVSYRIVTLLQCYAIAVYCIVTRLSVGFLPPMQKQPVGGDLFTNRTFLFLLLMLVFIITFNFLRNLHSRCCTIQTARILFLTTECPGAVKYIGICINDFDTNPPSFDNFMFGNKSFCNISDLR